MWCMCVCMCVHRSEVDIRNLPQLLSIFFIQARSLDERTDLVSLASQLAQEIPVPDQNYRQATTLFFYVATRDPNSGPHICETSALSTEPSPQSLEHFLYSV